MQDGGKRKRSDAQFWCLPSHLEIFHYRIFFLIQQFITRSARADRGSYFITMYKRDRLTWSRKIEKERKEIEERKRLII